MNTQVPPQSPESWNGYPTMPATEQSQYQGQVPYQGQATVQGQAPVDPSYPPPPSWNTSSVGKPDSHLVMSIIAVFFCWPLAIFAIMKATKVDQLWQMGQRAEALSASETAKKMSIWCYIIGAVVYVLTIAAYAFLLNTLGSTSPYPY